MGIFRVQFDVCVQTTGIFLAVFALAFGASSSLQALDRTVELLQTLSNAPGPSGLEEPVRAIMAELGRPRGLCDSDRSDATPAT